MFRFFVSWVRGSGKSTFLHVGGGMLSPSEGKVRIENDSLYDLTLEQRSALRKTKIGFVFQTFNLVPYLTALENVQVPLVLAGLGEDEQKRRAESLLSRVGLSDRMDHKPRELSVGQQQRVALARMLAYDPAIILADEPTGNLDPETAASIMSLLGELSREGRTIVMVTHDLRHAQRAKRDVTPQFAALNINVESPSNTTTVRIANNEETPVILSPPEGDNPAFAAELKTIEPGKQFDLVVRTVSPLSAGSAQAQFTLKTSSTNLPVITVRAWANVQPLVMVNPSQISLPATPLTNAMPYTLTIRNNSTNTLSLPEPMVTPQDIDVQLREIDPGRVFAATVTFPTGFELAPGKPAELSIKSSHPQMPVVKVPILQSPRPVPVAIPPTPGPMASARQ